MLVTIDTPAQPVTVIDTNVGSIRDLGTVSMNSAGDALFILQAGLGLATCELCVCDVNGSGSITASDALLAVMAAIGQPVVLNCPCCG